MTTEDVYEGKVIDRHTTRLSFVKSCSGKDCPGVGEITAGKIYSRLEKINEDFSSIPKADVENILITFKICDTAKASIMEKIYASFDISKIFTRIIPLGGTYAEAQKIYESYHCDNIECMKDNPYEYMPQGISFALCDNIAYELGVSTYAEIRVSAFAKKIAQEITSDGSTCCDMDRLKVIIKLVQKRTKYPHIPQEYMCMYILSSEWFVFWEENEKLMIQHVKQHSIERHIIHEMLRLERSFKPMENTKYKPLDTFDGEQVSAVEMIDRAAISIVTGGPGTGKTTVIKEFIRKYKEGYESRNIFLCAPSGRAASRIMESTGFPATTIHKLLGFLPYNTPTGENAIVYNAQNQLSKGLFIIDEASMVDAQLFLYFLEAVPNGSSIVLSGDANQLPSVQPGNILNDLIVSEEIPCTELKTIHRQASADSRITQNYYRILKRDTELTTGKDFVITRVSSQKEAMHSLCKSIKNYPTDNPYQTQILCFMAKRDIGKDYINGVISDSKIKKGMVRFGRSRYCEGDKIMMTSNNYEEDYWNGNIGTITAFTDSGLLVDFYDGPHEINRRNLEDMDHAWACTVHKAQGSEFENVIIMIDDSVDIMLYNNIILTAITRAKKNVHIITMNDALEKAITGKGPQRNTGLVRLIKTEKESKEKPATEAAGS